MTDAPTEARDKLALEIRAIWISQPLAWQRIADFILARERAAAEKVRAAIQFVLSEGMLGAHLEHWDKQGTHGANCPACQANAQARERLQDALHALAQPPAQEPNGG